jgi:hypothetical protein
MPRRTVRVTPKVQTDALPDWANEYVVLATELEGRGVLREIGERLRVARRDGYCGLDIFLFLLAYFSSGLNMGLRPFSRRCAPHARQLAAVGGRVLWPSSASVSRFLGTTEQQQVGGFGAWLLGEAVGARAVEAHRSILCRDTRGEPWHVFDYDPTLTTLRHRALPVGEELPAPERRSADMAAAGYAGRKRGEVQFSRATLQHTGSGLWLGVSMHPGNGDHRADNACAAASVRAWCERTGVAPDHAILRADGGAGGSVPAMTAYRDAGIHFVTRLARYDLLDHEQVQEQMSRALWLDVEDAMSGPQREASELGTLRLNADFKTVHKNGEPYASIETRLVASRIRLTDDDAGGKPGAGIAKDGWWYELFGTTLAATAWPAPEAVSLYYGRCGQENRFYQEDCELGLDRIFSYHLPGQQLANLVGLFVWNLRLGRGADLLAPMPDKLPAQPPRAHVQSLAPIAPAVSSPQVSEQQTSAAEDAPPPAVTPAQAVACPVADAEASPAPAPLAVAVDAAADRRPSAVLEPGSANKNEAPPLAEPVGSVPAGALGALTEADWRAHLQNLAGWRWDATLGLVCPHHEPLRLHSVENTQHGTLAVRWRARAKPCRECPSRPACSPSHSDKFRKEVWMTFALDESGSIAALAARAKPAPPAHCAKQALASAAGTRTPWSPTPGEHEAGSLSVAWPILIPSELRHAFRLVCSTLGVDVRVQDGKPRPTRTPFYFAANAAERQRRRRTWTWRRARNQLPDDARVDITLHGGQRLAVLLVEPSQALEAA